MKVYFSGNFSKKQNRRRKGRRIGRRWCFRWADQNWTVPGIYRFRQGLVLDLVQQLDEGWVKNFLDRHLNDLDNDHMTTEQRLARDAENPLENMHPTFAVNGKLCGQWSGTSAYWIPLLNRLRREHEDRIAREAGVEPSPQRPSRDQLILQEYGYDLDRCWQLRRYSIAWPWKNPPRNLHSLIVTFGQTSQYYPIAQHFTTIGNGRGRKQPFRHPITGDEHRLEVLQCEQVTLPANAFGSEQGEYLYPKETVLMEYVIRPGLPKEQRLTVLDLSEGDQPKRIQQAGSFVPDGSNAIGIIGGAVGVAALRAEQDAECVYSSVYFERPQEICWSIAGISAPKYEEQSFVLRLK